MHEKDVVIRLLERLVNLSLYVSDTSKPEKMSKKRRKMYAHEMNITFEVIEVINQWLENKVEVHAQASTNLPDGNANTGRPASTGNQPVP